MDHWPEMSVLFIRSRDPGGEWGGVGGWGPRKLEKLPFFPCASFGAKIGAIAKTLREINSFIGAPSPLRSM